MEEKNEVLNILNKKNLLIKGLEENIFKEFTNEEENLLHSKHGRIKVWHKSDVGRIYNGITGAFKEGLPLVIDCIPVKTVSEISIIDWDSYTFKTTEGDCFYFEFTPIKLTDLI